MSSSHSDAQTEVTAAVVTVAVESVSSSFSAVIVVGAKIAVVMVAVESVSSSFSANFFLVFVVVVVFYPPFRLLSHLDKWKIASRNHPSPFLDMIFPSSLTLTLLSLSNLLLRETTMSQVLLGILTSSRCSQSGFPSAFIVLSWSFLVFTDQCDLPSSEHYFLLMGAITESPSIVWIACSMSKTRLSL